MKKHSLCNSKNQEIANFHFFCQQQLRQSQHNIKINRNLPYDLALVIATMLIYKDSAIDKLDLSNLTINKAGLANILYAIHINKNRLNIKIFDLRDIKIEDNDNIMDIKEFHDLFLPYLPKSSETRTLVDTTGKRSKTKGGAWKNKDKCQSLNIKDHADFLYNVSSDVNIDGSLDQISSLYVASMLAMRTIAIKNLCFSNINIAKMAFLNVILAIKCNKDLHINNLTFDSVKTSYESQIYLDGFKLFIPHIIDLPRIYNMKIINCNLDPEYPKEMYNNLTEEASSLFNIHIQQKDFSCDITKIIGRDNCYSYEFIQHEAYGENLAQHQKDEKEIAEFLGNIL